MAFRSGRSRGRLRSAPVSGATERSLARLPTSSWPQRPRLRSLLLAPFLLSLSSCTPTSHRGARSPPLSPSRHLPLPLKCIPLKRKRQAGLSHFLYGLLPDRVPCHAHLCGGGQRVFVLAQRHFLAVHRRPRRCVYISALRGLRVVVSLASSETETRGKLFHVALVRQRRRCFMSLLLESCFMSLLLESCFMSLLLDSRDKLFHVALVRLARLMRATKLIFVPSSCCKSIMCCAQSECFRGLMSFGCTHAKTKPNRWSVDQ
jgi:hypothetical protein